MSAEDAYNIFVSIAKISWTEKRLKKMKPTWHEVLDEKVAKEIEKSSREKAKPFSFYDCWIKDWEEIIYTKNEKVKAKVISDKKVEYDWETMTLTWLARKLLKKRSSEWVAWPDYFIYKWKKINDIRREKWLINF
jgi:hypothetical protein